MKEKISVLLLALVLLVMASCAPSGTAKGDAARQPEPLNALKTETSHLSVIQTGIEDATKQPEPSNALKTETSDFPVIQTGIEDATKQPEPSNALETEASDLPVIQAGIEDATKQPEPSNALETETSDPPVIQPDTAYTPNTVRFDSKLGCSLTYDPIFFEVEDVEDEYLKSQSIESVVCLSVQSIWKNGVFPICVTIEPLNASSVEEAIINDISIRNLDGPGEETTFGTGSYTATHFTFNKAYAVGDIYVMEQNGVVFKIEVSSYHRPPKKELALANAVLDSITF